MSLWATVSVSVSACTLLGKLLEGAPLLLQERLLDCNLATPHKILEAMPRPRRNRVVRHGHLRNRAALCGRPRLDATRLGSTRLDTTRLDSTRLDSLDSA